MAASGAQNPYEHLKKSISINGKEYQYFDLRSLDPEKYDRLPYSIRVLLESVVRNCDGFHVTKQDVENVYDWSQHQKDAKGVEVSFKPARVILQDFTGVPALVDFAAMRDAVEKFGGDPMKINPICPADLVIDHSVQVDFFRSTKGSPLANTARPPPTSSCVTDLEDTTTAAMGHRLPVFRNLEAGSRSSGPPTASGRGTARQQQRINRRRSPTRGHGHSVERVAGTLIFNRGGPSVLRRRAPPTPDALCGGRCDGVTCMISTASVADAPCLRVESEPSNVDVGGASAPPPDLSGLPILDRLCPFHRVSSMWLVSAANLHHFAALLIGRNWTWWRPEHPIIIHTLITLQHLSNGTLNNCYSSLSH